MRQDLWYAFRTLRNNPGFTAVAVLCLALGIGANSAIFSLLDAALLRSLPVPEPEQLVIVRAAGGQGIGSTFSYPQYDYLQRHTRSADPFAWVRFEVNLSAGDVTDAPSGHLVSRNYFSALRVEPAIGRGFRPEDEQVAILSHRYWQARFHGDRAIAGRAIVLNGLPFTVLGVMPPRFFGVEPGISPDIYVPLSMCDRLSSGRPRLPLPNNFWLAVMARLAPGTPAAQAAAEMNVVYHQGNREAGLRPNLARMLEQRRIVAMPGGQGPSALRARFGTPLVILMAISGLVLLIACGNAANLMLARAAAREREVAVRHALGATRARLLWLFLTESFVLSLAAGALGLLFAYWSAGALTTFLPRSFLDTAPDARILAFTLAVSLLTALAFGGAPAVRAARASLRIRPTRFGRFLIAGQVSISIVLLIGAGLFIRTLFNLRTLDPGFDGGPVVLASLNPSLNRYTPERTRALYDQLLERAAALPGVQSASTAGFAMLSGAYIDGITINGSEIPVSIRLVTPRFFETMAIPLRMGRDFTNNEPGKTVIVNEVMASKYFPGQSPVGKRAGDREIIGVAASSKYRSLRDEVPDTIYLPMDPTESDRTLHVRAAGNPAALAPLVREQLRALDRHLPAQISLFSDVMNEHLAQERLVAVLAGCFGGLALLLAAIGLYGVLAYSVERRTREIGIRMSLGAQRGAVLAMVLRDSLRMVAIGVVCGVLGGIWLSRLVTRQLFGVAPGDPATIAGAAALMIAVAALAVLAPARRASRVDPAIALRYE